MAIGERIRFIRNLRGMTQKYLGMQAGFAERTADVRMAQYESGTRTPKEELTKNIAYILDVSPDALNVPNIDHELGFMHTMFAIEDIYGLTPTIIDGKVYLQFDESRAIPKPKVPRMFSAWAKQLEKYRRNEITRDDYDKWRYHYPKYDDSMMWVKVPSQELSDYMTAKFKDYTKDK